MTDYCYYSYSYNSTTPIYNHLVSVSCFLRNGLGLHLQHSSMHFGLDAPILKALVLVSGISALLVSKIRRFSIAPLPYFPPASVPSPALSGFSNHLPVVPTVPHQVQAFLFQPFPRCTVESAHHQTNSNLRNTTISPPAVALLLHTCSFAPVLDRCEVRPELS